MENVLDRLLTEKEVTDMTRLGRSTRWRLRKEGKFPPLVEIGTLRKANTLKQIQDFLSERRKAAEKAAATMQAAE